MGWNSIATSLFKRTAVAAAVIALTVRVLVPAGFMLAPRQAGHALPALVICTGHGPLMLADPGHANKPPGDAPQKRDSDHACVFAAAHAPAAATIAVAPLAPIAAPTRMLAASVVTDQRPGLGLAAPPPPSQGPPQNLI